MPKPIALCLEDLDGPRGSGRYMTCVAVRGGDPGLGVDRHGKVAWRLEQGLACELWVSADEQLILLRPEGAPSVRVTRAGRALDAPFGKPVVLLDQDCVETAGRRFRVHVHGVTGEVVAPAPFAESHAVGKVAVAVAMGVAAMSCHKGDPNAKPVEVREQPPSPPYIPPPDAGPEDAAEAGLDAAADAADAADDVTADSGKVDAGKKTQPIEIRPHPPKPVSRDKSGL